MARLTTFRRIWTSTRRSERTREHQAMFRFWWSDRARDDLLLRYTVGPRTIETKTTEAHHKRRDGPQLQRLFFAHLSRRYLPALEDRVPRSPPIPVGAQHALHAGGPGHRDLLPRQLCLEVLQRPVVVDPEQGVLRNAGERGRDKLVPGFPGCGEGVKRGLGTGVRMTPQ